MGFNRVKATATSSLLSTIQLPEIPVTHFIDSEGWKTGPTLKPPSGFEHRTSEFGIQRLDH